MKDYLIYIVCIFFLTVSVSSCMEIETDGEESFDWRETPVGEGVFILNEGNFMYGNASLSFYASDAGQVENEVFVRANSMKLGDVAQSMTIHDGVGYIVVNNSGVVFVIDIMTCQTKGYIKNLTSPRFIHFINDTKAYITDLYASRITIVNPETLSVTGYVDTDGHRSTEQMVGYGDYVFTNCWSGDNTILVIDTNTDKVVDKIEVGIQPHSMVIDRNNKIWVLTDGGYDGSPYGWTIPSLYRIDAETRKVEKEFRFGQHDWPRSLSLNGTKDKLYFINESVWEMGIEDEILPKEPVLKYTGTRYYSLGINPYNSDIYVADALDYVQRGVVYRLNETGEPLDTAKVGITPGAFCFR